MHKQRSTVIFDYHSPNSSLEEKVRLKNELLTHLRYLPPNEFGMFSDGYDEAEMIFDRDIPPRKAPKDKTGERHFVHMVRVLWFLICKCELQLTYTQLMGIL